MKLEIGILNLETVRRLGARAVQAIDQADRRAVEILKAIAGRKLNDELAGPSVKRRTGNLAKSAVASIANAVPERTANGWSVVLGYGEGPSAKYAKQIEFGGTITAKGRVLAIPIGENLTATGRTRYASPRDPALEGGFWKSFGGPPLFLVPRGRGRGLGDRLTAFFVGKKSVTQTGKFPAKKAREEAQRQAFDVFETQIARALGAV